VQAADHVREFMSCEEIVRADPRWQAAMRKARGRGLLARHDRPVGGQLDGAEDDPAARRISPPADLDALGAR